MNIPATAILTILFAGAVAPMAAAQGFNQGRPSFAISSQAEGSASQNNSDGNGVDLGRGATAKFDGFSFNALLTGGTSTARNAEIEGLQGSGHDPRRRGFTVQNVEWGAAGRIEPYVRAEGYLVTMIDGGGDTVVELEEAFFSTLNLPAGLEFRGGYYFTEFGLHNVRHPHQWRFLDAAIIQTRMFGEDGMRAPGARLAWESDSKLPTWLGFGIQDANVATMSSFGGGFAHHHGDEDHDEEEEEEGPGVRGRPFVARDSDGFRDFMYSARIRQGLLAGSEWSAWVGASLAFGPNGTGTRATSTVWGLDFLARWQEDTGASHDHSGHDHSGHDHGHVHERGRFFEVSGEYMQRRYRAAAYSDLGDPLDPADDVVFGDERFHDYGAYAHVIWGFTSDWAVGLRLEWADASGGDVVERTSEAISDRRYRVSPMVQWSPDEALRVRGQLNFDNAQHLGSRDAISVWVGIEFLFGAHPVHRP